MVNSSCFSAALFQRLKIHIRFVLYFPCCAPSLYEVMPHTGNSSIIYLVAQSSFLQTGWHNILSMVNASGFFFNNPTENLNYSIRTAKNGIAKKIGNLLKTSVFRDAHVSFIIIVKHKEDNYSPCHGCRFRVL